MAAQATVPANVQDPGAAEQAVAEMIDDNLAILSQLSIDAYLPTNIPEDVPEHEKAFRIACAKRPYLDGKYFTVNYEKSKPDGNIIAVCKTCVPEKVITGRLTVSSNYTTHLRRRHDVLYEQYKHYTKIKRQRMNNGEPSTCKRTTCSFNQEQLDRNIAYYILESGAPLKTVEMPAFRRMFDDLKIKAGNASVKHMSRRAFSLKVDAICTESVQKIQNAISTTKHFCTTADIWTGLNRRFIGVTLHWIDEESLERKSAAIACTRFPGTHSHTAIADTLVEIHASFGLDNNNVIATVTDNGSNFVKAFKVFGVDIDAIFRSDETHDNDDLVGDNSDSSDDAAEDSEDDDVLPDEPLENEVFEYNAQPNNRLPFHLRCASHTLHLIATTDVVNAIKESPNLAAAHRETLERCNWLWKSLRSPKTNEALNAYLGKALLRPVVTRWNSLYDSLKRLIQLKDKILQREMNEIVQLRNPLKPSDFRYLEEYIECTKPLADAIDILQGESYCFYGYLLPTLVSLRRKVNILLEKNTVTTCKPLLNAIKSSLESRFETFFSIEGAGKIAAIAAVTHPKFKTRWLTCFEEATQQRVRELILKVASEERARDRAAEVEAERMTDDDFFDFGPVSAPTDRPEIFYQHGEAEVEICTFLTRADSNLNSLKDFPLIRKLFLRYNTPLPSSAPVERLFSYATMMAIPKFNRLTDAHFEKRVLFKANAAKKL